MLITIRPGDFRAFIRLVFKWSLLAGGVGVLAGTASAIFLVTLDWATEQRLLHPALLGLLPIGGFLVGWVYHRFGGEAVRGTNLIIDEIHTQVTRIPLRMAPLVLVGTIITHLFGGSAGREGTALQMGASLADGLRRLLRLNDADRRLMIMAGISGGFGSVFGTPIAGMVFGMEVQSIGRVRYEGIMPCLIAACVGDLVTRAWGVGHTHYPALPHIEIAPLLLLAVGVAGIGFGVVAALFIEAVHGVRELITRVIAYPPLRPVIGGLLVVGLALLLQTDAYLGLSLPLLKDSVSGTGVDGYAFLLKIAFTALTLGSGFMGGEVTPLFVIGATFGYAVGGLLGVDPSFMASIGFVAVFAGASNTPLACALMGMELFGGGAALYLIVGCAVAYAASGHRSIYVAQRIDTVKVPGAGIPPGVSLREWHDRTETALEDEETVSRQNS